MTNPVETDPVCALQIDPLDAAGYSEFEDKVYYFCSDACKKKFDLAPADYADES